MAGSTRSYSGLIVNSLFLVTLVLLIASGFYLHNPFFPGEVSKARYLHLVMNYLMVSLIVLKIYFMMLGVSASAKPSLMKRTVFGVWLAVLFFQALVTFSVYLAPSYFASLNSLFGGLPGTQLLHYFLMWILSGTLAVYAYAHLLEKLTSIDFSMFRRPT